MFEFEMFLQSHFTPAPEPVKKVAKGLQQSTEQQIPPTTVKAEPDALMASEAAQELMNMKSQTFFDRKEAHARAGIAAKPEFNNKIKL